MERYHFRLIEKILYNQKGIELAVRDARAEQLSNQGLKNGGGGHAFISNPTEQKALKLATPIKSVMVNEMVVRSPEKWLAVIESVYATQNEECTKLLRKRYYKQNPNTIILAIDFNMSRKTVYNICQRFVEGVFARASYEHLINPYETQNRNKK